MSTGRSYEQSAALYARATSHIPGGVNSPVRAMRSVGRDVPVFIESGSGSIVRDADGNEFVDWVMSWGALPLGHAHPAVVSAADHALRSGSTFGAPTRVEVELAELVCELIPGAERARFVSSGTEATMTAIRLARGATGRDAILKFSGCYHGHSDALLADAGSGVATLSLPASPGVPEAVVANTLVARYNDLDDVRAVIAGHDQPLAAIIVEPVAANMGVVLPDRDFLHGLRAICDELGALLIFDEVITGFRLAPGGAQEHFGIQADIACFGKIVGGGFPVGALAGRAELLDQLAPAGSIYQAGTLSGNPVAMAAGLATLNELSDRSVYREMSDRAEQFERLLTDADVLSEDSDVALTRIGSLMTLFHLGDLRHAPHNFDQARQLDVDRFAGWHADALEHGHLLPPSQFEALFISTAHTPDQIESLAATVIRRHEMAGSGV